MSYLLLELPIATLGSLSNYLYEKSIQAITKIFSVLLALTVKHFNTFSICW